MDHDTSDILGQKPRLRTDATRGSVSSFSMTQAVYTAIVLVGLIVVSRRIWKRVLIWREQSYKLATRRRHGIPDSDQRPFNVAYSEAMTRARDEQNRRPPKPRPSFRPQAAQLYQRQALQGQQTLRNRTVAPLPSDSDRYPSVLPVPGRFSAGSYDTTSQAYNDSMYVASGVNGSAKNGLNLHDGMFEITALSDDEIKAINLEQDLEAEHEVKNRRAEVDGIIDRDEDAESKNLAPKRGSKRGIHDDENDDSVRLKKSGGKRARKVSQNHDMDVDDEEADEITELKSTTRGKKRDRAEAGSTFGGDDEDSENGQDVDVNAKARRHRKRRTVAKRKSEATYARGKKRDREDGEDSTSEESSPEKKPSHKKGKRASKGGRHSHHDKGSKSDVSMDESVTSTRSKVRSIGDEWESNGIKYKIGPNGQRLRQALVRKEAQKFVMPKDSLHPDRDLSFEVCVETWMTEEEYQQAKAQHILAWQDLPSTKEPKKQLSLDISQTSSVPQVPPSGKNLLWSSTTTTPTSSPGPQSPPPESLRYRGPRHSIATGELPYNPFTQSRLPTSTKRITSNAPRLSLLNESSPGLSDSTNGSPRRIYSKWEKQELEAQALMKIRDANKKKEMEKEAKLKEEKDRADRLAAEQQRLQQERERAERERAEREKTERERAEAERKRKEEAAKAAPAAVPNISFTAPSPQPPAPATNGPVPNGLFSVPPAASGSGSSPFGMPKPAQSTGGQPAPAAPSLFGNVAQPSSNVTQPPSTGFSFNLSGTSSTTSGPSSFFAPPTKKEEPSANANTSAHAQGPSLLYRLGAQTPEAPKTQTQPTTTPLFSFPKADSSSSSGAPQSQSTSSTQPATGATSTPSAGGSALKFNFGVPNKTTTPTPAPMATSTTMPSSSSLSGALGPEPPKAAATSTSSAPAPNPIFNFKTPTTPASAMTNGNGHTAAASTTPASATPLAAPKFNFGQTAFGGGAASGTSAASFSNPSSTQNKETVKSAFGNVPATSAFGNANANGSTSTSTASPFGNTSSASAFGKTNSTPAFGSTAPSSAFGSTTPASAFGSTTPASAFGNTKPTSAFGNASTTPAFGKPSAFGNAAGSGPSPFGATAAQTSSVFGGGSTGNAAGAGSKPADESTPAPKLTFNFGGNTTSTPASTNAGSSENKTAFPSAASSNTPAGVTSTSSAASASPFSFKFGQSSSTTPASSPFGAPAGKSAFGNLGGTSSTPSVFGSSAFGAPAQSK